MLWVSRVPHSSGVPPTGFVGGVEKGGIPTLRYPLFKDLFMAEPTNFPYETRLDILHGPLEPIDIKAMADACEYKWFNQTLCQVNSSVVRVGIIEGEYHWHKHDEDDEFFYVVEGKLLIDLEDKTIELNPGMGFVVPRTVLHRTRAPECTIILMVENAGIIPTGN
jgi:mannose-6-phosphate isomerase-like protein (cupin superfamily)